MFLPSWNVWLFWISHSSLKFRSFVCVQILQDFSQVVKYSDYLKLVNLCHAKQRIWLLSLYADVSSCSCDAICLNWKESQHIKMTEPSSSSYSLSSKKRPRSPNDNDEHPLGRDQTCSSLGACYSFSSLVPSLVSSSVIENWNYYCI